MRQLLHLSWGLVLALLLAGCNGKTQPDPGPPAPNYYEHSDVVEWNFEMTQATRTVAMGPTYGSRWYYMVHAAIYDAWAMYDDVATPIALDPDQRRPAEEHTLENKRAAVNYAAYLAINRVFPNYDTSTGRLTALLAQNGFAANPIELADEVEPSEIGRNAVDAIWASRDNDGSNAQNGFADTTSDTYPELDEVVNSGDPATYPGKPGHDPNRWTPIRIPNGGYRDASGWARVDNDDPSSFVVMANLTPHWGAVTPFALSRGNEFRPPAPPRYGDNSLYTNSEGISRPSNDEAMRQLQEVVDYSASIGDREKVIARYWAQEFTGSMTPPGHLNMLVYGICQRDEHTLDDDVKVFLAMNAALFDSGIAAWECKRFYNNNRPITAVRHFFGDQSLSAWNGAGRDHETVLGQDWLPFMPDNFTSPPFPDYVSGHATFTAAFAQVLTQFTGSEQMYDGVTRTRAAISFSTSTMNWTGAPVGDMLGEFACPPGQSDVEPGMSPTQPVILRWSSFFDAAEESGISRLYMGIHFREASLRGQELGVKVAQKTMARCQQYWTGQIQR
jgi:hypothetical protein